MIMFCSGCGGFIVSQFVWRVVNSNTLLLCGKGSLLIFDSVDSDELYQYVRKDIARNKCITIVNVRIIFCFKSNVLLDQ